MVRFLASAVRALLAFAMVLLGAPSRAQGASGPSSAAPALGPIERLWWIAAEGLTGVNIEATIEGISQWLTTGTFDAFSVGLLPPTFYPLSTSVELANTVTSAANGQVVVGVFPAGTEGWETSFNQQFALRLAPLGVLYNPSGALTLEQWLAALENLVAPHWGYVLEQPARKPTAEELLRSAGGFARSAKQRSKRVAFWLSAMMLEDASDRELVRQLHAKLGSQLDWVVWMDLPMLSAQGRSLEELLATALALVPREKVFVQLTHHPNLPTKDIPGTLAYLATCQGKGVKRFVLLANPQLLRQEPWASFYRELRSKKGYPVRRRLERR